LLGDAARSEAKGAECRNESRAYAVVEARTSLEISEGFRAPTAEGFGEADGVAQGFDLDGEIAASAGELFAAPGLPWVQGFTFTLHLHER
jgi:hypothetical protein